MKTPLKSRLRPSRSRAVRPVRLVLLALTVLLPAACRLASDVPASGADHAALLRLAEADSFVRVDIYDAWHAGTVMQTYVLVPAEKPLPARLPDGVVVRTPLRRAVCASAVHAGLLFDLGKLDAVAGVCDADYVCRPELREALADGRTADAGSSMTPDVERLLALRPDALLVSPFENAGHGPLSDLGIPVIECADYMEPSALGRAEWMKFYGLLFGCREQADTLYNKVCAAYDSLRRAAQAAAERPRLMCDRKEGSSWHVPAGDSYLGALFADAGAAYLFADRRGGGSVPLSFETVWQTARSADVWLIKYGAKRPLTYDAMAAEFPPSRDFAPWRRRQVYGCNTFDVPFYETVPFRPDLLLRDVVRILHPEILPEHRLRFYRPL